MARSLRELLDGLEFRIPEERGSAYRDHEGTVPDIEICAVVNDGRKIPKGCLFICCRDTMYNGSEYIEKAAGAGASVIVTEESLAVCAGASVVVTEESLSAGTDAGPGHEETEEYNDGFFNDDNDDNDF